MGKLSKLLDDISSEFDSNQENAAKLDEVVAHIETIKALEDQTNAYYKSNNILGAIDDVVMIDEARHKLNQLRGELTKPENQKLVTRALSNLLSYRTQINGQFCDKLGLEVNEEIDDLITDANKGLMWEDRNGFQSSRFFITGGNYKNSITIELAKRIDTLQRQVKDNVVLDSSLQNLRLSFDTIYNARSDFPQDAKTEANDIVNQTVNYILFLAQSVRDEIATKIKKQEVVVEKLIEVIDEVELQKNKESKPAAKSLLSLGLAQMGIFSNGMRIASPTQTMTTPTPDSFRTPFSPSKSSVSRSGLPKEEELSRQFEQEDNEESNTPKNTP